MMTRRTVMTAGALGMLSSTHRGAAAAALPVAVDPVAAAGEATAAAVGAASAGQPAEVLVAQSLREMQGEIQSIRHILQDALIGPSLAAGPIEEIRRQFTLFLRSNQKFPDYCEVGPQVFIDLYDWHVRHRQPIELSQPDGRSAIRFMFTWMILRPDQVPNFVGMPFDRG